MKTDHNDELNTLCNAITVVNEIDYDDYMTIMCDDQENIHQLKSSGLSFSWGNVNIRSFLLMKTDFIKWYNTIITHNQKQRLLKFIDQNYNNTYQLN